MEIHDTYYGEARSGLEGIYYSHIYRSLFLVQTVTGVEEPIKLKIKERQPGDPESDYWGWLDTGRDYYSMIWASKAQFSMCFPYGYEAAEARGVGRACNLIVEKA